jgi:hypothetical protein
MSAPDNTRRQIRVTAPDEPPRVTPDVARVLLRIVLAALSEPAPEPENHQEDDE